MASILYIPHGGGPLPLLGDPAHEKMVRFLKEIPGRLGDPEAVLIISAHWEELKPSVTSGKRPAIIYDYNGFPDEAYRIEYPAPGKPELAERIVAMIENTGGKAWRHSQRGFDHGVYVPLKIMYPDTSRACVQLSLISSLDPSEHIALGRALANLRKHNLLILGSGFSFHNLRALMSEGEPDTDKRNLAFQDWLVETCTGQMAPDERYRRLVNWESTPHARFCHPREEHLLPLHVCCAMAGSAAELVFEDTVMGRKSVAFLWPDPHSR
jgi:aromatic ring-opening dioxygenase catalytic subunit (LigB family)